MISVSQVQVLWKSKTKREYYVNCKNKTKVVYSIEFKQNLKHNFIIDCTIKMNVKFSLCLLIKIKKFSPKFFYFCKVLLFKIYYFKFRQNWFTHFKHACAERLETNQDLSTVGPNIGTKRHNNHIYFITIRPTLIRNRIQSYRLFP